MPSISRFFGIVIYMYYYDTGCHKAAHFHAEYAGREAVFGIHPLGLLAGGLPATEMGKVMEWAAEHQDELLADWKLAVSGQPVRPIPPLGAKGRKRR